MTIGAKKLLNWWVECPQFLWKSLCKWWDWVKNWASKIASKWSTDLFEDAVRIQIFTKVLTYIYLLKFSIFRLLAAAGSIISLKLLLSCSHLFQFLLKLESAISQIVRQSSSLHEAVIVVVEQSSGSHQAFIRQPTVSCQTVWQSSGIRLAVVWQSSGSHLAVIKFSFIAQSLRLIASLVFLTNIFFYFFSSKGSEHYLSTKIINQNGNQII